MFLQLIMVAIATTVVSSSSSVSCDFGDKKGTLCAWHRTWENMERSNWKLEKISKRFSINEHTGNNGYFLQYKPGKKYMAKRARIVSKDFTVTNDLCLSFWHFSTGSRYPFPKGIPRLSVTAKSLKGNKANIFRWNVATEGGDWQFTELQLDSASRQLGTDRIKIEISARKGRKFKTAVGIDDIKVGTCAHFKVANGANQKDKDMDLTAAMSNRIVALPAHRIVTEIRVDAANFTNRQELPTELVQSDRRRLSFISKRRKKTRRGKNKNNRRNRNRTEKYGIVYLPDLTQRLKNDDSTAEPIRAEVLCDFIKYTQRIQRCIRTFFENMHNRRTFSRKKCSSTYGVLENCLQRTAVSCVPEMEIPAGEIKELITTTLQEDLKAKEVYCEEEGAFVYPDYSFARLDLNCTRDYFIKLSQCGTPFSSLFNIEHGDPHLCRKYYTANECQRQTIAEECNFNVKTMIRYGLNLQYQFAHNPFCVKLPFSAWWPDT